MDSELIDLLKNNSIICFDCEEYQQKFKSINNSIDFCTFESENESNFKNFNTVLGKVNNIKKLEECFWKYDNFKNIIIIDIADSSKIIEPNNKYQNTKLWDMIAYSAKDDIECGGWYNSYNHNKFSLEEMTEFIDNIEQKLNPYITKDSTVLEIGCSSGLTMFRLAHKVKKYIGTDFSQQMINKNNIKVKENQINNIDLYCVSADNIDSLNLTNIDVVIINSVIQLFNGYHYFYNVLKKLNSLLHNQSVIFIGDIMDLKKKDELISSALLYKKNNINSKTKLDFSNDLFFSKDFFEDLEFDFPYSVLDISSKNHTIKNELTNYRYDVLLQYETNKTKNKKRKTKNQYFFVI